MIHVCKSNNPPSELASKGYNDDAVRSRLLEEQHDKCYLCERLLHTNYQVEHLKSKTHYPALINEWTNLFVACEYCNDKKLDDYDDILNPSECKVEQIIRQLFDAKSGRFIFEQASKLHSEQVDATIHLLNILFNGKKHNMLTLKEKRFRQDFFVSYNSFLKKLNNVLASGKSDKSLWELKMELEASSEFLGFKYWVLAAIPQMKDWLSDTFPCA